MDHGTEREPVVRVRGVNHAFGHSENRKNVLLDNSIDVWPGEIVIMTGPSGSGKTTLLTLIGALRSVQAGTLETLGRPLHRLRSREMVEVRRQIGFIFQGHNLFESLTALENVSLALEIETRDAAERRRAAAAILERLGLGARLDHKPQALSGGQRQRVAVARALAHRPKLVLADEPTAALDGESGREVVNLLRDLARESAVAVLMVTHDGRILDVADRIVNMVDGAIVSDVVVRDTIDSCQFLVKCPLFTTHSASALAEFAQKMVLERFAPGAVVIRQGDPGDRFYVVRSGTADVSVTKAGGEEVRPSLGVGDFFGEIALLTGEPRSATVVARNPLELLSLSQEDFRAALSRSKSLDEQLREVLYTRT